MTVSRLLQFDCINHWMTWLRSLGARDADRSYGNLLSIADAGIPDDLMEIMILQMERELIRISDVDRALNNLQRFVHASRSPLALATLMQRDESTLSILLHIFSASQYLSDLIIQQPENFDHLRLTGGQPVGREDLVFDLAQETEGLQDIAAISRIVRRFKQRETLRIAYGDILRNVPLQVTSEQISYVADSVCQAAYSFCFQRAVQKWGLPTDDSGTPVSLSILALGKHGGTELNYSSDIDLILFYGAEGKTTENRSNREFFEWVTRLFLKVVGESTEWGAAYRVDLRLRPEGNYGALTQSASRLQNYYENRGRTWERQAFLKARPVAGDLAQGQAFLDSLQHWIYPKFLSQFQIEGISAIKRQIEKHAIAGGEDQSNIKTGRGGIRDVEFTIQFLQLLHAAEQPKVRTGNTLDAIARLGQAGCLTLAEEHVLEKNYRLLRMVEHRLQLMFDLQTHRLPEDAWELRKLALRCGVSSNSQHHVLDAFIHRLHQARQSNRHVLNHLLHHAFDDPSQRNQGGSEAAHRSSSEVDLILDPTPSADTIAVTLQHCRFADSAQAYRRLIELSRECSPFLSDQRCRHFFAAISKALLQAIAVTPNPDQTLTELSRVADSLGNKGVLWELLSFHRPSMDLLVRLCAAAPYLSQILTGNPGMLDELMDSLLVDQLPSANALHQQLAELLRGAEDPQPILQSFKDAHHLLVGVRDVLGKQRLAQTHATLADIAEVCVQQVTDLNHQALCQKWGQPLEPSTGRPMMLAILALGKLGGREPNYHSDLDLVFIYPRDGTTTPVGPAVGSNGSPSLRSADNQTTAHQHFFSRLATAVTKTLSHYGPQGRLFDVDCRLRPAGKNAMLAVSLDWFVRYFSAEGEAQLWERLALCKARVFCQDAGFAEKLLQSVHGILQSTPASATIAREVYQMRLRLQKDAPAANLKRGVGGTVDIEFSVQMLQMIHSRTHPEILVPGTMAAIQALADAGLLAQSEAAYFAASYEFMRGVEARLRLLNTNARHNLPTDAATLEKLAYLLRIASPTELVATLDRYRQENRQRFEELIRRYAE